MTFLLAATLAFWSFNATNTVSDVGGDLAVMQGTPQGYTTGTTTNAQGWAAGRAVSLAAGQQLHLAVFAPESTNITRLSFALRRASSASHKCPQCGGSMRILAAIQSSEAIRKILDCLGLPSRAPPVAGAAPTADPQLEWA